MELGRLLRRLPNFDLDQQRFVYNSILPDLTYLTLMLDRRRLSTSLRCPLWLLPGSCLKGEGDNVLRGKDGNSACHFVWEGKQQPGLPQWRLVRANETATSENHDFVVRRLTQTLERCWQPVCFRRCAERILGSFRRD